MSFCVIASPVGRLRIAADNTGICGVNRTEEALCSPEEPLLEDCARQLAEYFSGARRVFDLPLHPVGTAFRIKVWSELQQIPYGQTTTYGELARRVGNARGARAVGGANHHNPISIIIAAVAALVAGLMYLWNTNEDFKEAVLEIWESIKEEISNAISVLCTFLSDTF